MHHCRRRLPSSILDKLYSHPSKIHSLQDSMDVTLELVIRYHERKKENNHFKENKTEATKLSSSQSGNNSSSSHKKNKNYSIWKRNKHNPSLFNDYHRLKGSEKERRLKEGLFSYSSGKKRI
ncbi:hypothetical protein O181_008820 [Austropuccinia psidii MF-1]|uniref:Uncharacterized protein n=1 Tax=Austropuccinia psidii MF-1 TaxID=1389203 RepID=A0A9Q3GJ96_9BASI|nr:hypothetical protein [Austropuccinia psidii MF-1]